MVTGTNKNRYPFGYLFLFITYAWRADSKASVKQTVLWTVCSESADGSFPIESGRTKRGKKAVSIAKTGHCIAKTPNDGLNTGVLRLFTVKLSLVR